MNGILLRRLVEARGAHLPFQALADATDNLGRDLNIIEAFGFPIEHHPVLGVALRGAPERLCPDQIEAGLTTACVGRRIAVWDRVTSTNDLAARAARSTANEGLVVLAEEQTAGRGRRGRTWTAPARRSILMSVLLFPRGPLADPAWLTALGAVAVAEVVAAWTGRDPRIKWPNDVRVEGRKIAGILAERAAGAVLGIGLNANHDRDDFPDNLQETATSMRLLLDARVDRSELARDLILRLDDLYNKSRVFGPVAISDAWRNRSEHLGRFVQVETRLDTWTGRLDDLHLIDGLTLSTLGGERLKVATRDIVSLMPREDGPVVA